MDASAWIALASLAAVVVAQLVALAFLLGGLFNRIKVVEGKPGDADCKAELKVLASQFHNLESKLSDIAQDVKNLITGRVVPARRRANDA